MQPKKQITLNKSLFVKSISGNIKDLYEIKKEIGKGAYGRVFLALTKQQPPKQKQRAIKQLQKKSIKQPLTFVNEIEILKKLDHPNIIKIYETLEDESNYYVVTDFCEGGELFDRLANRGSFTEDDARQIFKQMLEAVNHCHTQKIAHRDLKPQNFLFLTNESNSLKLIDFGLSFTWNEDMNAEMKQKKMNKMTGTSYYIAPEVIRGDYSQKCDIWSLGVILYILVTAVPPFDGKNDKEILESVKKGFYSLEIPQMKFVSQDLKDLIQRILQPENKRISIEEIFKHPWMNTNLPKNNLRLNFGKMINFSKFSKLKTFAVTCIASQLAGKQIQKLGNLFRQIDVNHDGFISTKQLKASLDKQRERTTLEQVQKLMNFIDTDHNGKINYTEFIACCLENSIIFKEQNLNYVFNSLDTDGNGFISPSQLREALIKSNQSLSPEVIEEILQNCDKNKDGVIDFKQFLSSISQFNC